MAGGIHHDDDESVTRDGLNRIGSRGSVGCDGRGADVRDWRRRRCRRRVAVVLALIAAVVVDDCRGHWAWDYRRYRHCHPSVGGPRCVCRRRNPCCPI